MKFNTISHSITLLAIIASSIANATDTAETQINNMSSSPIVNSQTKTLTNDELLSCKVDSFPYDSMNSSRNTHVKVDKSSPELLNYLNDKVKKTYNTMRNGVIRYVTMKVAMSLFNFNINGFAPENIASYVSDGTKPFLPFKFANGVKITKVTPKGGTIVYRTEMPISKSHNHAVILAAAGMIIATTTVCNDKDMVEDLLGHDVVIQYDYYDSNGVFFSSFTING